eukprot:12560392-Alexandrium_andersonii.AAC.1
MSASLVGSEMCIRDRPAQFYNSVLRLSGVLGSWKMRNWLRRSKLELRRLRNLFKFGPRSSRG